MQEKSVRNSTTPTQMTPTCSHGTLLRSKFTNPKIRMERSHTNKKIRSSTSIKTKRKLNVDGSDCNNSRTKTSSLSRNINKINNTDDHRKKKSCRKLYDPHKKYGIDIPSYDDILKDQKNCQDYKKVVQSLTQLTTSKSDGDDNFRPKQRNIATQTTPPLSPVTNKIINTDKHIERESCKEIYDPSEKYGMNVPSYDDILNDKKNCQDYKKSVQSLTYLTTSTSEGDDNCRPKQSDIVSQTSSTKTLVLSRITNEINNTDIEKRSCKKVYDASKKYSIDIPSYEDILRDTRSCRDYKESVQSLVHLVAPKSNGGDNFNTKRRKEKFKVSGTRSKSKTNFTRNKKHNTITDYIKQKENDEVENPTGKSFESVQKYGVCVPSYEDILRDKKNCDNYSNFLKNLTKLITSVSEIKTNPLENQSPKVDVPNCKHMSKEAIISALERNFGYLDDIHKEKVYCERHERYKKLTSRNGLTYSTSMIAFTNEQKQLLVMELSKYYSDSDYYFKVLLPEVCLKIFMDEYSMTRDEARKCMDRY